MSQQRPWSVREIPASQLNEHDLAVFEAFGSDLSDPEHMLKMKIEGMAWLLGCSEEEAEALIFKRAHIFAEYGIDITDALP